MQGEHTVAQEAHPAFAESWWWWDPSWWWWDPSWPLSAADGEHPWSYKPAVPFPHAGWWGYGSLSNIYYLKQTTPPPFIKMFDSWRTGRAWAPGFCRHLPACSPGQGRLEKGQVICVTPFGRVWSHSQNESCSPASGVDGALSFWEWVSDVWPLKHILKNHKSLVESKSWGLCFKNMVRDCRKHIIRNDAKQCFGSHLWERRSWAIPVDLSKTCPSSRKLQPPFPLLSAVAWLKTQAHFIHVRPRDGAWLPEP